MHSTSRTRLLVRRDQKEREGNTRVQEPTVTAERVTGHIQPRPDLLQMSEPVNKSMALPISIGPAPVSAAVSRQHWHHKFAWLAVFAVSTLFLLRCSSHYGLDAQGLRRSEPSCPQQSPLVPSAEVLLVLEALYSSESFQNRSAAWLSGAVKIPYAEALSGPTHSKLPI